MKKLILALLLLSSPCYASQEFKVGTEFFNYSYKEPNIMSHEGLMYGVTGSYEYKGKVNLRTEGRYSFGDVDYNSVQTGSISSEISDYSYELRQLVGINLKDTISPYIGIGYRYLNDAMNGHTTSTGQYSFDRESNYLYVPIGFDISKKLKYFDVSFNGELDAFLGGKQISHMEQIPTTPSFPEFNNRQRGGMGARASIEIKKGNFSIGPFIRYWNIKQSDGVYFEFADQIEPKNNTTEIGVQVKLGW